MLASSMAHQYGYAGSYNGINGIASYGDVYSPMNKRRRTDDGNSGESSGGEVPFALSSWDEPHGHGQASTSHGTQFSTTYHGDDGTAAVYGGLTQDAMDENARAQAALAWAGSLYPTVSSYQQPYFYQQTDPATYTSPWPPTQDFQSIPMPSSTYAEVMPVSGTMLPFYPTQTLRHGHGFDAGTPISHGYDEMGSGGHYDFGATQIHNEPARPASTYYLEDASMHLKLQSLNIFDNLATQIIQTIAKASFSQVQELVRGQDADECQPYITLKNLFEQTRKVYSRETPFINALETQMFQPSQQEIMRKANVATFISSVLSGHDISYYHLNEFFLETFVPMGNRLLKWQGAIYLELKTQTYISSLMTGDGGNPEAMLNELFPPDLDAQILTRHPDAPSLGPSEQDFIDRSRARKSYLMAEPSLQRAVQELPKKYQWNDFVREFASGISKNVDSILNVPLRSQPAGLGAEKRAASTGNGLDPARAQQTFITKEEPGVGTGSSSVANVPVMPMLPHTGSFERKTGGSSTVRQPWTKPEEDALLEGLGKVNGPHWSQILARHGRGGSVSELLKDRNQVQLKDKARNLKLWYLKMGKEVPTALRGVTGELRKRGGARARAALGLLDEEQDGGADADGEGIEGENIDPTLGARQARPSKKKGGVR